MSEERGRARGKEEARVSKEELHRIANLARLRPKEGETERLLRDLNRVLEHVASLEDVDVEEEEVLGPTSGEEEGRVREEGLSPDSLRRPLSELAPRWEEGFFAVPRLPGVEGDEEAEA